ncbi:MAG TPA: hydrolase, partial [Mesotoga sp.]|nr:hydrolase [Mesotoga sp.]
MPDFKTHVTWGLFSYPVYMLVAMLIIEIAKLPIIVDSRIIGTGYLLYILGSDLPDIDSKQALI